METVTISPELIKSLEKNRSAINSAFEYFNSAESHFEYADISGVFVRILNPLFDSGYAVSDKAVISIFRCLLKLVSRKLIGRSSRDKELELHFFTIAEKFKNLTALHGDLFLLNVINSLLNLSGKKNFSLAKWVPLLLSLPENTGMDDFRKYGLIAAWICGAASARESIAGLVRSSDPGITGKIFNTGISDSASLEKIADVISRSPWRNPLSAIIDDNDTSPVYRTAGGFRGYGYEFKKLPAVVSIDECFYATDGSEVYRVYADYYGIELVHDSSVDPELIQPGGVINRFVKDGNFLYNQNVCPLPDGWKSGVTSIAFNRNTVIWTLNDSYKLYVAGVRGKNA